MEAQQQLVVRLLHPTLVSESSMATHHDASYATTSNYHVVTARQCSMRLLPTRAAAASAAAGTQACHVPEPTDYFQVDLLGPHYNPVTFIFRGTARGLTTGVQRKQAVPMCSKSRFSQVNSPINLST